MVHKKFNIKGKKINLEIDKGVFVPTHQGLFFANNLKVKKGGSVIDVGTGCGILAILAAKEGGIVSATDINPIAIENAQKNAKRNKVKINFEQGSFFGNFNKKFDIIIANLPQEILPDDFKMKSESYLVKSLDGGLHGNSVLLKFLELAKKHMKERSRIYIFLYSGTNYLQTIERILKNYEIKLSAMHFGDLPEFMVDNVEKYEELNRKGEVSIFQRDSVWKAYNYVFELRLKDN